MTGTERDTAFHAFVAARYSFLVRFGYLLLGDPGQAEDLVQAALLRTYGAWRRLRDPANAEAYTRKIMLRLSMRWRRRGWRGETPSGFVESSAVADPFAQADLAVIVRRALLDLPVHQRAVMVLRFYEDLTESQAAKILGCSVGTIKSRTSRALAALRASGLFDLGDGDLHISEVPRHGR